MRILLFFVMVYCPLIIIAQTNCSVYNDKPHKVACELYNSAIQHNQGSRESQQLFLESLNACPSFAPSLHEMSVPYLKRGDFYTWKLLIDQAVVTDPTGYLGDRGWCLFKFLKDYQNSYNDLNKLYQLTNGQPGYSGDGDYDLQIIMALCKREMGDNKAAILIFNKCISEHEKQQRVGLFDYLHRGVTYLAMRDYKAAITNFNLEIRKYEKLADTYYYLGLTYLKLHRKTKALLYFNKSQILFTKNGYHRSDPYCEEPDQVYLSDIKQQINSLRTSVHRQSSVTKINIVNNFPQINSIQGLLKPFKGKPVFVDLWASWCNPCKEEFKFIPALYKELKKRGVVMLYISIDKDPEDSTWKSDINKFKLYGYHVKASKALRDELTTLI